jgi:hypothetical protein
MRYENEEKKVRTNRIHTWDLLDEVDKLLAHIPNWEPFKWDPVTQQKYKTMYFKQFGGISGKKKKK